MPGALLLCTDLDRTLLPNGPQPESPGAREAFARLVCDDRVTLAYVTGRHRELMDEAIGEYGLPWPAIAVTDVGTRIHTRDGGDWRVWDDWEQAIAEDWRGHAHDDLRRLFADLDVLRLQAAERQNAHKLSYELPVDVDPEPLRAELERRLEARGVRASLVFSVDEVARVGLLDVLPRGATKRHAVEFMAARLGFPLGQVLYAGDSGNDLEVLVSGVPSVLVANADDAVRREAASRAARAGHAEALYVARGGSLGMNGNYAAGILEGVLHFHPDLTPGRAGLEGAR